MTSQFLMDRHFPLQQWSCQSCTRTALTTVWMKTKRPSTAPSSDHVVLLPNSMQTLHEDEDDVDAANTPTLPATSTTEESYDWPTFISAYSWGRWDPHKTPNPPKGVHEPDEIEITTIPTRKPGRNSGSAYRLRNSFSSSSVPSPTASPKAKPDLYLSLASSKYPASSVVSAATLRLAGTNVNLSPLALPSPEQEFTDPMKGVSVVVPGVHPDDSPNELVMTPGGTRKIMLKNFWKGVSAAEDDHRSAEDETDYFSHATSAPENPLSAPLSYTSTTPPRRATLTRQSSAPLPGPLAPAAHVASMAQRTVNDEQLYNELGYFTPPDPPDEIERRRALYKFNLWNSASDINFDRIAHLAKLVFNTKGVFISLIDAYDQYFKSEWGIKVSPCSRMRSFCAHSILQRDDEPMIILDAQLDWRFVSNPLVTGPPNIRFYAGAPLRTQDGYNVGTLVVIDDSPRDDFTPRHRHTLKEFAAIAMREMELWRDKIQLRIRDRIQKSMEQFSRECIEIDVENEVPRHQNSPGQASPLMVPVPSLSAPASSSSTPIPTSSIPLSLHADQPKIPRQAPPGYHAADSLLTTNPPSSPSSSSHQFPSSSTPSTRPSSAEPSSRPPLRPRYSSYQHRSFLHSGSMDKVYSRAARLVQRTLDVEGVIVMDVSHCDMNTNVPVFMPGDLEMNGHSSELSSSLSPDMGLSPSPPNSHSTLAGGEGNVSVVMHYGDPTMETKVRSLSGEEWGRLGRFFDKWPEGRVMEGIVDSSWRGFLPTRVGYALTVPIFNIDKRPFALLCAYNSSDSQKRFLEGHELSYLRAIGTCRYLDAFHTLLILSGVIILSAVLKRRMILADKAKSLFISNISHELRTPLHGILAAAELLDESNLSHSQTSFLQTIQACGTSLVETVNHVLDFTKLSGNSKSGGVENVIVPTTVNLMQLVEEAVDGCWVGHRARQAIVGDTGIGSVYSPPTEEGAPSSVRSRHVETVIEIGHRQRGWLLKCEKGGIRRVLMNLFGNSLKFTTDGYVHVGLRQLPRTEDLPSNKIKVELSVLDTGKGISHSFLKNHLFHPFSQENPLQTGTGLGLAIVHSIVRSESVDGKVDVWSDEGVGTEIKVTFPAEVTDERSGAVGADMGSFGFDDCDHAASVSLIGFGHDHRGVQLLESVMRSYVISWGFEVRGDVSNLGDIVILNEDVDLVVKATEQHDTMRPFIVLSGSRGSSKVLSVASDHERIGGFCRILYKPGGPSRLRAALKLCIHALKIQSRSPEVDSSYRKELLHPDADIDGVTSSPSMSTISTRRNSEETGKFQLSRPTLPRSITAHPLPSSSWKGQAMNRERFTVGSSSEQIPEEENMSESETFSPTISVGMGGTLLKSSVGTIQTRMSRFRILVVEDNSILRSLLAQWLAKKGYDFRDAVDGRDGVKVYQQEGPFDVVLLDLSMPVLDGVGATAEIRQFESRETDSNRRRHPTKILALTGMSSLEDKRRAFEAGVDGYLVKPVAFKTLDAMFHKLGIS
ncbi:uncharacterized protein BT62DRAFT_960666 [Guyanagaster necrorhizus]|uniref:histidine kinase n=1 Tax=Guyanagaster necrorhizus TaxID=856835 RepID=A0A9P7W2W6_9AGAR|nr:uncharacterized protein BT62DRAFT_960666 [Guyanagaster necrorhizus MCA 3950]KAG7451064.1 hypothetical protein BT62DRAFT_960666 [Guyanagaster necrorhizus MCA 3950]